MNDNIYIALRCYNKAGLTRHTHRVLFERLARYRKKYSFTENEVRQLRYSIQYPLVNGLFVVMLDVCNENEFRRYMKHSIVPNRLKKKVNSFYKQVKDIQGGCGIDVHTFNNII